MTVLTGLSTASAQKQQRKDPTLQGAAEHKPSLCRNTATGSGGQGATLPSHTRARGGDGAVTKAHWPQEEDRPAAVTWQGRSPLSAHGLSAAPPRLRPSGRGQGGPGVAAHREGPGGCCPQSGHPGGAAHRDQPPWATVGLRTSANGLEHHRGYHQHPHHPCCQTHRRGGERASLEPRPGKHGPEPAVCGAEPGSRQRVQAHPRVRR